MKQKITAGEKFGHLEVLRLDDSRAGSRPYWICRCDCGTICSVAATHLMSGHTKSCGCLRSRRQSRRRLDLTGDRYGRLEVLGPMRENSPFYDMVKDGEYTEKGDALSSDLWICRCDCGKICVCQKEGLRSGTTQSCGCLRNEQSRKNMRKAIHFADNTCVERIASRKTFSNNTSGHRGVYLRKNGTWRASIGFQGKVYNLGSFRDYEDAVQARLDAEKKYYDPFLEQYRANMKK